jgi:CubicO group peptidase (beta-lactamase class C family)
MANRDELQQQLEIQRERTGTPGIVMGILHGDTRTVAAAGVTNIDHPLAVTENTLFQIGSITKTMTATVAMRLVEQGLLALDTPIRHYLPHFALQDETVAAQATLRHLFTHLGGWVGDYFENTGHGDDALARMLPTWPPSPNRRRSANFGPITTPASASPAM